MTNAKGPYLFLGSEEGRADGRSCDYYAGIGGMSGKLVMIRCYKGKTPSDEDGIAGIVRVRKIHNGFYQVCLKKLKELRVWD